MLVSLSTSASLPTQLRAHSNNRAAVSCSFQSNQVTQPKCLTIFRWRCLYTGGGALDTSSSSSPSSSLSEQLSHGGAVKIPFLCQHERICACRVMLDTVDSRLWPRHSDSPRGNFKRTSQCLMSFSMFITKQIEQKSVQNCAHRLFVGAKIDVTEVRDMLNIIF